MFGVPDLWASFRIVRLNVQERRSPPWFCKANWVQLRGWNRISNRSVLLSKYHFDFQSRDNHFTSVIYYTTKSQIVPWIIQDNWKRLKQRARDWNNLDSADNGTPADNGLCSVLSRTWRLSNWTLINLSYTMSSDQIIHAPRMTHMKCLWT